MDYKPKYKRVLLKLSGEALAGTQKGGIDHDVINIIASEIKKCYDLGVEIGIVVGGGNFWRGRSNSNMDRTKADQIGMLATVMNALSMADALEQVGVKARVQTSVEISGVAELFTKDKAEHYFKKKKVLIFGGGTGHPFFSTDTAASLRAAEIEADVILKASVIDGVYDSDPNKNKGAKKYKSITFSKVLEKKLGVIDSTAASMCSDNKIPLLVFSLNDPANILKAICGEDIGTVVDPD